MSCHDYGISRGCDLGCPYLWDGECEIIEEFLEITTMSTDEELELREIYELDDKLKFKSIW